MPPGPPVRNAVGDYHFHVYDYVGSAAWQLSAPQPARNGYSFYSMLQDLNGLVAAGGLRNVPNIAIANGAAATTGARQTMILSLGNLTNAAGLPTVLITGGIHAREWAATEMAYLLAEYLIVNYQQAPATANQRTLKNLVDSRNIRIIPMLNPDGNDYTVFGAGGANARLWRKNRRNLPANPAGWVAALTTAAGPNPPFTNVAAAGPGGSAQYDVPDYDPAHAIPPGVPATRTRNLLDGQTGVDLNRNLATQASGYDAGPDYASYNPVEMSYFGPSRGGEIETANLQAYATALGAVAASIDYHAFGQLIIYAGEASHQGRIRADYLSLGHSLHQLIHSQGVLDYQLGTPLQTVRYEVTGSVADYLAQLNQSRAFTVEVDPPLYPNPGNAGFMLDQTSILAMFRKNIRGALAAIAAPVAATTWYGRLDRRRQINASSNTFLGWNVYNRGNQLP